MESSKEWLLPFNKRAGYWQVWRLYWNEAIGWNEMELVSGLLRGVSGSWKGRSRQNEIGAGIRVNAREGNTLAVGLCPANKLNERPMTTGSGEPANRVREWV